MVSDSRTSWEEYQRVLKMTGFTNHHWGISTADWAALSEDDRQGRIGHLSGYALMKTSLRTPPAPVPAGWGDW